ncbi:hypothetical protein TGAMA5MH_08534 [Trichoderma gamsii]|uniref:Uncharacterized protein n=1 Tax=Trichoderma gamsii TaxID=398673 RepID=A0A2K0T1W2_9HYPO|nr:hypothetical protein TGAMA5MH_08534 [Trichoderma gamsii]
MILGEPKTMTSRDANTMTQGNMGFVGLDHGN